MTWDKFIRPEVIVALDVPGAEEALKLAETLAGNSADRSTGARPWLKVGLELFTAAGPDMVRELTRRGAHVFLDLKLHDIPNTVGRAAAASTGIGARMITLHLAGGEAMARAAVAAVAAAPAAPEGSPRPITLGITLLTSQGPEDLPPGYTAVEWVAELARRAKAWGLDGVVCSGHEAAAVKSACGKNFLCVTPGIRPAPAPDEIVKNDDQRRVMTPAEAVAQGADFLVIGRPITQAGDPAAALRLIRDELGNL